MSSVDFPVEKFRFGMLLSDTRYRSTSLQVITFIFFVAGVFWLVDNTVKNYLGGLRSTCTYTNSSKLEKLADNCKFIIVNNQYNNNLVNSK